MNTTTKTEPESIARLRSALKAKKDPQQTIAALQRQIQREAGKLDFEQLKRNDPRAYGQAVASLAQLQAELTIAESQSAGADLEIDAVAAEVVEAIVKMDEELNQIRDESLELVRKNVVGKLATLGIFDAEKLPRLAGESSPVRRERAYWGNLEQLPKAQVNFYITGHNTPLALEVESAPSLLAAYEARIAALPEARNRRATLK